jgi:hypothetical protein
LIIIKKNEYEEKNMKRKQSKKIVEVSDVKSLSQTPNAIKLRERRSSKAKKSRRCVGQNGRPPCCEDKANEVIYQLIVEDADNGIFHNIPWLQILVFVFFF